MDLLGKSLTELQELVKQKKVSGGEVRRFFDARIKKYDKELNSYITTIESDESESADIPIAIKDILCTQGIRTTAGSKILDDYRPQYDATVVSRLNTGGLSLLGKTNLDAWCHGSSTETSDYGPTNNPYDVSRAPGGSSGGSAAAVAAYLAPAAIGTDTGGSIRQPSAWCGTVGLRPSYGRVSRYGLIAMASSWDCPGPITATVEDAAHILQLIAGRDPHDATTIDSPVPDYQKELTEKKTYTIGIADEYFEGVTDEISSKVMESVELLKKMGHTIKKVHLMSPKYAVSVYMILQRAEVSSNLGRYDGIRYGNDRTHFGKEAKRRIMLGTYVLSHGYYDQYYKKAQKVRALIAADFKKVFQEVDFIVGPTTPVTALKLGESEKYSFFGETMDILNEPASAAGIPAISIPVGLDSNQLPIGMQIMAPHFAENRLLNIAHHLEKEIAFDRLRIIKEKYG